MKKMNKKPVMIFSNEEWRDVVGFEGYYKVSNLGRVKSCVRYKVKTERILSNRDNGNRYRIVCLSKQNKMYYFLVHRLVAISFIPNPKNLDTVDHIDEIRTNNCVDNLRWMTNIDNWRRSNMGEDNGNSKMTRKEVDKMRKMYQVEKISYTKLANIFNISKAQVCVIINRKNWK